MLHGWPSEHSSKELQPYRIRKKELSVIDGCILLGLRVIFLPPGREQVVQVLHETHPGIAKMKNLA